MNAEAYMRRALALARHGELDASPNPMVGAVIVAGGRIIGEGWHRQCGHGHAEVNAIASVSEADRSLLGSSVMYVTLEPCSHYGKTPPCASLIISTGIPKVEVAVLDPFEKVSGRGVKMLRDAGIEVGVGLLADEARRLNRRFFTAHMLRRPFVTLKWAQSADGFIDGRRSAADAPARISTPLTTTLVHRLRALNDAVVCGSGTWLADSPSLTVRNFAGDSPRRFVWDRRGRLGSLPEGVDRLTASSPHQLLADLYNIGVTSLLVEGGAKVFEAFLRAGLYDCIRVEVNPRLNLATMPLKIQAPPLPCRAPKSVRNCDGNTIYLFDNNINA